ncbi:MAG: GTPase HflX, partial [Candidatus Acidiferrales bacterium]
MRVLRETSPQERVLLVGVELPRRYRGSSRERMDELSELAASAGAKVQGRFEVARDRPDAATLLGRGQCERLGEEAAAREAGL